VNTTPAPDRPPPCGDSPAQTARDCLEMGGTLGQALDTLARVAAAHTADDYQPLREEVYETALEETGWVERLAETFTCPLTAAAFADLTGAEQRQVLETAIYFCARAEPVPGDEVPGLREHDTQAADSVRDDVAQDLDRGLADRVEAAWQAAAGARADHLHRVVARATHLLRLHVPSAADGATVALVAIHDADCTVWHVDGVRHVDVPHTVLIHLESILTQACGFGLSYELMDELRWKQAAHDDPNLRDVQLPGGDVISAAAAAPSGTVWLLHHSVDARYDAEVTPHATEQDGLAYLAEKIRQTWYRVTDLGGPGAPDDGEAGGLRRVR